MRSNDALLCILDTNGHERVAKQPLEWSLSNRRGTAFSALAGMPDFKVYQNRDRIHRPFQKAVLKHCSHRSLREPSDVL